MKFILLFVLALSSLCYAESYDLTSRWSVGGGAGFPITFPGKFDDRADGDFAFNFHGRYNFNNHDSVALGYSRYEFDHTPTCPRVYDALYSRRLLGQGRFSPVLGLGAGVADIPNYNVDENLKLALRGRVGLEYAISESFYTSVSVDYVYVGKMVGERRSLTLGDINTVVPQVGVSYVFGR